ncbi:MAG TPA: NUDIX domain-containing protein [Vicinamibacteria bacterium]|jgi:8-oxo-dGTP diphosphatase
MELVASPPVQSRVQNVKVAVDNCIFTVNAGRLQVLLIQMRKPPFQGMWALPGGLIDEGESLGDAASRILREQTGVEGPYLEQLYTFDGRTRDPEGRVLSVAYYSLVPSVGLSLRTTPKYEAVRFWHCQNRPAQLGYDHDAILHYAQSRLQAKVQYSNVMWSLLPRSFPLRELQAAYEAVLDRRLDKRNFRKKILSLGLLRPSGEKSKGGRHRPAMLYEFASHSPRAVEIF